MMPSLIRVPITVPAAQIIAVRQLPRARLAPNMAKAISTGHAQRYDVGKNAEAIRQPTGSCSRLCLLVLAQRSSADRSTTGSKA